MREQNMHTRTLRAAIAGASVLGLALAGCAGGGGSAANTTENGDLVIGGELIAAADVYRAAQDEGGLVFYTGASEQSEGQVAEAFTEATGIDVEIVRLAPNKLTERVLSETAANKLGADVIRISGEDLITSLSDAGAFQATELAPDVAAGLVPEATYDNGLYFNSFDRVYSLAYNNQVVPEPEAPKNWADLLDPRWQGRTGVVQVGAGGSTAALTRFQLQVLGEGWMRDYAATAPRIYDSSAALTDGLARGAIAAGAIPVATGYSAMLEGAPITIATPAEGAAAYPFYLGKSSSMAHSNAATVFVNWLMSSSGQQLATSMGDYSVRQGMPNPTIGEVQLPAADSGFTFRASLEESLAHLRSDADLWMQIFGYTG
jgi:iron(III) transport system substrate-binding protein